MIGLTYRWIGLLAGTLLIASVFACSGPDGDRATLTSTPDIASGQSELPTTPVVPGATTQPSASEAGVTATPEPGTMPTETLPSGAPTEPSPSDATSVAPSATSTTTVARSPSTTIQPTGAILPDHRIVSYYGHPNSSAMGILGEYEMPEVYERLREQGAEWEAADPSTPVILAFELIATVAQPYPGDDGLYVVYTGDEIIGEYVDFVTAHDMILILDLQIGHDTIPNQINLIRHWLELPNVHVAIDPEFSMKANETIPRDRIPGEFIGEVSGRDVQVAMEMLAEISIENNIPAKILIVHQFEDEMIYHKDAITPIPGVQFVLDMDGFGGPDAKLGNYSHFVSENVIEFGGIKLFYRQDDPLLTPDQLVGLFPPPLVVIYQ
jgi:hypothetical protein